MGKSLELHGPGHEDLLSQGSSMYGRAQNIISNGGNSSASIQLGVRRSIYDIAEQGSGPSGATPYYAPDRPPNISPIHASGAFQQARLGAHAAEVQRRQAFIQGQQRMRSESQINADIQRHQQDIAAGRKHPDSSVYGDDSTRHF